MRDLGRTMTVRSETVGVLDDRPVLAFVLDDGAGLAAKVMEYGATLSELHVADSDGNRRDIVLGFDTLAGYVATKHYLGATVGRYANRIPRGTFSLNGNRYTLSKNEGSNHLHGGFRGFDKAVWRGEANVRKNGVRFFHSSPDGDEGYPGAVTAEVEYSVPSAGRLTIEFTATADRPTIVNLVNHTYFNLAGHSSGDVLKQCVMLNADAYAPVDNERVATGKISDVYGSRFDFTAPKQIGRDLDRRDETSGYDHNWILRGKGMRLCAQACDPISGLALELWTTEPGVQFYVGGLFTGSEVGKGGCRYSRFAGFTLETQRFSGNFPLAVLQPGQTYRHLMDYRFEARRPADAAPADGQ